MRSSALKRQWIACGGCELALLGACRGRRGGHFRSCPASTAWHSTPSARDTDDFSGGPHPGGLISYRQALAGTLDGVDGVDGWRGLFVLAVPDIDTAKQHVATDPVIAQGERVAEYHRYFGSAVLMLVNQPHAKVAKSPSEGPQAVAGARPGCFSTQADAAKPSLPASLPSARSMTTKPSLRYRASAASLPISTSSTSGPVGLAVGADQHAVSGRQKGRKCPRQPLITSPMRGPSPHPPETGARCATRPASHPAARRSC